MIINEITDPPRTSNPPRRRFFADQPALPPPRTIHRVPNNAPRKTLAELFASYNSIRLANTNTTPHATTQNGPILTHTKPNFSYVDANAAYPTPPNPRASSSYNPTQYAGPPQRLWFPPRPPGQDIDGNAVIPDNPWTPAPLSAIMEDAPRASFAARSHSITYSEQPTYRRMLATAPVLPDPPTSVPKYVSPFLPRPITLPPRIPIPPKSSPENVSPRSPTAPGPQLPDAPFLDLNNQPFHVVPSTVHVLEDWPYGPLLDAMSPRSRRFAVGGTDADENDLHIYHPQLNRDTYLECLPPRTRVDVHCTSRACELVCELDGRAGACRRRNCTAKDAAHWEPNMWLCEGCGKEMEMEVLKDSEGNPTTDTEDGCCRMEMDEKDE